MKSGTPETIVNRVNEAVNKALAKPNVQEAFAQLGAAPAGGTSAEFRQFVNSQLEYWGAVVKESGMKMHQ